MRTDIDAKTHSIHRKWRNARKTTISLSTVVFLVLASILVTLVCTK